MAFKSAAEMTPGQLARKHACDAKYRAAHKAEKSAYDRALYERDHEEILAVRAIKRAAKQEQVHGK